jgi:hypothetical protein
MRGLRLLVAAGLAAMLTACLPVTTKTPVGTTAGLGADPALIGTWKGHSTGEKGTMYFHFLRAKDGGIDAVLVGPSTKKDDGGWMVMAMQTAKLGERQFINARAIYDGGKPAEGTMAENTIPLLYSFDAKGVLTLSLMDEDAAKAAVKAGKIAGTVGEGQFGDVTLTADAKALDAFMQSADAAALFVKPFAVLRKTR